MLLKEILKDKGTVVRCISPEFTLDEAVAELVCHNIGALLVGDVGRSIQGIITERDMLRTQNAHRETFGKLRVAEVMSKNLITASPEDHIETAMGLMTEHRIRHLPILCEGQLCGIVSIGDIVKAQHSELERENNAMRSYIQGESI
ncbi:MAG: CBS domain-containing protein [Planctomycetes bacterium]|nr:CBS domain-containing protein [Planctomycetota bacterium]